MRRHIRQVKFALAVKSSKRCSVCKEEKQFDDFYVDRAHPTGRGGYCKICTLERSRRYRAANGDALRERDRTAKSSPEGRAKARDLYWANPDIYRAKALRNKNMQKAADAESRRRARMHSAGAVEKIDRLEIYERDGGRCHICSKLVSVKKFHLDHLVPIARGGTHTRDNVAVAHRVCNQRRGADRLPAQLLLVG